MSNKAILNLNGHNPDSYSAKRRADLNKSLTLGVCKCHKCGAISNTLYKVEENKYICKNCKKD